MILRDSGNLVYPSPEEFRTLGEVMHDLRSVDSVSKLGHLSKAVNRLVPHEFSGCGLFSIRKCQISVGHSTYSEEFCHLYTSQGFVTDPAIQLLQTTPFHLTSSEDSPEIAVPREILSLKLDFGIRSCFSVGVRGGNGLCTYFVFSNFAPAQLTKLRTFMEILSPHLHLSYLRSSANDTVPSAPTTPLTPREEEIMRWVSEGKTNWEISVILKVSLNTVRTHLRNVCEKLGGVENRWNAAAQWQWSTAGLLTEPTMKERRKPKSASEKSLQ